MDPLLRPLATLLLAVAAAAASAPPACLAVYLATSAPPAFGYLVCGFCATPRARLLGGNATMDAALCDKDFVGKDFVGKDFVGADPDLAAGYIAAALLDYGRVQGRFWADDMAAQDALAHLLRYMPVRDAIKLFQPDDAFLDYVLEHVRLALLVRAEGPAWARNESLSDREFRDYVLPYAFLNEKRDVAFRWRHRFFQLFYANTSALASATAAMHFLAAAIPKAAGAGALVLDGALVPGPVVRWESETSPMRLSPEQVIDLGGGSCTGTAVVLAAAARAVGIAARVAGCSQSIPGDDHHWIEYLDRAAGDGPLGEGAWHTKEGTSRGNAGGPWDAPSGPMNTCLQYLVAKDKARLNTIWASSWSSPVSLPLQWGPTGEAAAKLAFVGGENRCGAYCTAWGCGKNQTERFTQAECDVPTEA
jgi:hypothetical protein